MHCVTASVFFVCFLLSVSPTVFGLSLQVGDPVVTLDRLALSLEESASRDLLSAGTVAWPGARARGPREEALLLRCSSPRALRAVWEA